MKNKILSLMEEDYEAFIKGLISIESNIEDEYILEKIYGEYMQNDNMVLLNEELMSL